MMTVRKDPLSPPQVFEFSVLQAKWYLYLFVPPKSGKYHFLIPQPLGALIPQDPHTGNVYPLAPDSSVPLAAPPPALPPTPPPVCPSAPSFILTILPLPTFLQTPSLLPCEGVRPGV